MSTTHSWLNFDTISIILPPVVLIRTRCECRHSASDGGRVLPDVAELE